MKKVGVVSCYFKNNYGSILQAYATRKFLDENNIPNETVNVSQLSDFSKGKRKYYISQAANLRFLKTKSGMIKLKGYARINRRLKRNFAVRNRRFEEFKRNFVLTRAFSTYSELHEYAKNTYSDVIVGSDQLWLPVNVVADYYTLNWVPEGVNTISYATSFGVSGIPPRYHSLYRKYLEGIRHLSVREEQGVRLVRKLAQKEAKLVCDPTLLLTKDEWMDIQDSERIIPDKYIFCYFLGANIEHRKFVERLKEETGYKIVSINHCDEYVRYSDKFADIVPYDVGPGEFINYIRNAEYVCTDSFHGTAFSLINNVRFFTFRRYDSKSDLSTNSRIHSLLNVVGLNDRLIYGTEDAGQLMKKEINFDDVNSRVEAFRKDSAQWLLNSITWRPDGVRHIEIDEKSDCCGCTACAAVCPRDAIEMAEDSEGFRYPRVDPEKCIDCGLCRKVCPILNNQKEEKHKQDGYIVNNKDNEVRKESTSGGAFSAIADYVISRGGCVFGAAFGKDFTVTHQCAETREELSKFRNSKYVQSSPEDSFRKVKELLESGRMVCYSGTPCQIEGLRSFLGKEYENLVLVDVVCRAVPSPKLFRTYLNYIKETKLNGEDVGRVIFRDKSRYGYKYTLMTVAGQNTLYQEGIDTDPYLRAFFSGLAIRPSCENCRFKKQYRPGDFTLWDCFNTEDYDKQMDDNIGTTKILVQSDKGRRIFGEIRNSVQCLKVDNEVLVRGAREMVKSTKTNPARTAFFEDFNAMDYEELNRKYFPTTPRVRLEKFTRRKLVNLKSYKAIKKAAKKVLGKY